LEGIGASRDQAAVDGGYFGVRRKEDVGGKVGDSYFYFGGKREEVGLDWNRFERVRREELLRLWIRGWRRRGEQADKLNNTTTIDM
jgi:hypothetical protein